MAHSNGKITAPVGIDADIAPVLGVGNYDLGYLCRNTHGKINKWAKYKPVRQPWMDERAGYWKAADGGCGITLPVYTAPGTLSSGFLKDLFAGVTWPYDPPTGGDASPFRALDFNGYNHNSIMPFGATMPDDIYLDGTNSFQVQIEQTTVASDNLSLSDFAAKGVSFSDMYAGVGLLRGSTYLLATSTTKLVNDATIKITNMGGYTGNWKMAVFMSSVVISVGSSLQAGTYIPLPITPKTVTIHSAGSLQMVEAFGTWTSTNAQIRYNYIVTNNGSSSTTVSGIKIILVRAKPGVNPSAGETVQTLQQNLSHTVAAKSTYTSSIFAVNVTRNTSYIYYLAALATGISTTYMPVEDDVSVPVG